jgi:hypothetical protein
VGKRCATYRGFWVNPLSADQVRSGVLGWGCFKSVRVAQRSFLRVRGGSVIRWLFDLLDKTLHAPVWPHVKRWQNMRRNFVLWALLPLAAYVSAQSPPLPAFDAASVRPDPPGPGTMMRETPGNVNYIKIPLVSVIARAWNVQGLQVAGPDFIKIGLCARI